MTRQTHRTPSVCHYFLRHQEAGFAAQPAAHGISPKLTETQTSPEHAEPIQIMRLLMKASLAHHGQQYEEAIQAATEVIDLDSENTIAYRYRASAYWYSEQFVEALLDYTHLIETQEVPNPGVFSGRGQVYAELGDFDQALKDLEKAVEMARASDSSGLPFSLNGLGRALTGLGRLDEAEVAFRESLSLQPDNAWLHFNRGLLYLAKNEPQHAGHCFDLSLRLTNPRLSPRKHSRAQAFVERLKNS